MFMGLRMIKGIEEKEFENRFGKKVDELYKEIIEKHIALIIIALSLYIQQKKVTI